MLLASINWKTLRNLHFNDFLRFTQSWNTKPLQRKTMDRDLAKKTNGQCFRDSQIPITFTVEIKEKLRSDEFLGLTGDVENLGSWQLRHSIAMHPLIEKSSTKHTSFECLLNKSIKSPTASQWTISIPMCPDVRVSYRYFIFVDGLNGCKQIRRWESHKCHRQIITCPDKLCSNVDQFGVINGEKMINRGWLTNEFIVQFKLERGNIFELDENLNVDPTAGIYVKVLPMQSIGGSKFIDMSSSVEVVKMIYGKSTLHPQESVGIAYKPDDIVIFHITLSSIDKTIFDIVIADLQEKPIGNVKINSSDLSESQGKIKLPILDARNESKKVGSLNIPYVVIKPVSFAEEYNFQSSFSWNKSWQHLDTGHRGLGQSFIPNPSPIVENTIASFLAVVPLHGDAIELDVQLTSDLVPVVFHNFEILTAPKNMEPKSKEDLNLVYLKDLSYEDLKDLRVFFVINDKIIEYPSYNSEPQLENRLFPTLIDVFEALPKTLAIDVELKYPIELASGDFESKQTIDKNVFSDKIINATQKYGCDRPILYTSFDPDLCTMLRFKQNTIPVGFLTQGKTKKWTMYMDRRTRSIEEAVNQAQAFEFVLIAPHAEDIIENPSLIKIATDLGIKVAVWGDDLNRPESIKYFKDLNSTFIIYDRMDLNGPKDLKTNKFENNEYQKIFETQCLSGVIKA